MSQNRGASPDFDELRIKSKILSGQRMVAIQGYGVVGLIHHSDVEFAPVFLLDAQLLADLEEGLRNAA